MTTRPNPQVAVQLVNGMIAKKVPAYLGPTLSATCRATLPLVQSQGPVSYCMSPSVRPPAGSFMFAISAETGQQLFLTVKYLRGRGYKRIALISSTDASGTDGAQQVQEALKLPENKDVTLVAAESFNTADIGVQAQVAKIKAADPQALIVWASGTPFGTVLRGLRDAAMNVPVATSDANMPTEQMKQYADILPKTLFSEAPGYIVGSAASPAQRAAQQQFINAVKPFGISIDYVAGAAWDPGSILVSALRAVGPEPTAEQVRAYIAHLKSYPGLSGVYDFSDSQRGLSLKDLVVVSWDASKRNQWLKSSEFGGAVGR